MKLFYLLIISLSGVLLFSSCKREPYCVTCNETNRPPDARAGVDQKIAFPIDSVFLDGSSSSDLDGIIASHFWRKTSGPLSAVILYSDSSRTLIKSLTEGVYEFELTIKDNGGLSAKDTVQVIVGDPPLPNYPPVANAGVDQTIILPNNTVSLDGGASTDPNNNIASYAWTKISGPASINVFNANTVQTRVADLVEGIYEFELKLIDSGGLFSKDTLQVTVNSNNLPPKANAGNDMSVNYDLQICNTNRNVSLNSSNSTDPDGIIVSYFWTGPGIISNAAAAITQVGNLMPGKNNFILKVTDDKGATGYDTVLIDVVGVNRPLVNAQLVLVSTLSHTRQFIRVASAANKIVFAGEGTSMSLSPETTSLDIYDITSNTWTSKQLTEARTGMGVAVYNNKIFFAGGTPDGGDNFESSTVDIYDASANSWSSAQLGQVRSVTAGATNGNRVLFAGGMYGFDYSSSVVDLYDVPTNSWSIANLSEQRIVGAATTIGNKTYFAGGLSWTFTEATPSSRIDVYDAATNTWAVEQLSQSRAHMAGIAIGNKNYWAGGYNDHMTNSVEIKDAVTKSTSFACLFQPNSDFKAVSKNNKIVFFTGSGAEKNKFDIYDVLTNTWSIGVLSQNIEGAAIISVHNTIYVAGGYVNGVLSNRVWKLEF
jgi:hypothetical protein